MSDTTAHQEKKKRPSTIERARLFVAAMPAAIAGSHGHNATFAAACILVKGWNLRPDDARALLHEYNQRCAPPWSDRELDHKLQQADKAPDDKPRGYLIGEDSGDYGKTESAPRPAPKPKLEYDPALLERFSAPYASTVDLVWLANRSEIDPATVDSAEFLRRLYMPADKVLLFNVCTPSGEQVTQGEAVFPKDAPLTTGKCGVWFLPQPVDGQSRPNPRNGKISRRSMESCIRFPWLVLESDDAPLNQWLGAIVRLPLKICAIYTSGGRSVHCLVRVNATTKAEWDSVKTAMRPGLSFLIANGLDEGVLSAVRLSRLPGAYRQGKVKKNADGSFSYIKFAKPRLQKLLYLAPSAQATPICELPERQDVISHWCKLGGTGISDADETGGQWIKDGLSYYAKASNEARALLAKLEAGE